MLCSKCVGAIDHLNDEDRLEYYRLHDTFGMPVWRASRNCSSDNFRNLLCVIQKFVMKGDEEDGKRALATGILWIKDGIAVNALLLSRFISKSKSSINGGFHALGYGTIPSGGDISAQISDALHIGHQQFSLLRHWTVRRPMTDFKALEKGESLSEMVHNLLQNRKKQYEFQDDDWGSVEGEFDFSEVE
jgi:hypothetical protein